MKYFIILFIFFCCKQHVFSQDNFFLLNIDSLKISERIGGAKLDSVSDYNAGFISLNPGGYKFHPFGAFQNNYSNFLGSTTNQFREIEGNSFKYTSLPHLGFQYSFGSKGIQILHTDFEQFFSKKFGINISIDRTSIGEMIRDGSYKNNKIYLATYFRSARYKNFTSISHYSSFINQNGGLDSTSSVKLFSLDFLKVNKLDANSELKNFKAQSQHYFNFLNDTLKDFGLVLHNDLKINNRVFIEKDSLSKLYNSIYIDSFATRDQFQFARINSEIGIYSKTKLIFTEILLSHGYWDYQNSGKHLDTNELSVKFNFGLKIKNLNISNKSYYNIVGAQGEWFSKFKATTLLNKTQLSAFINIENQLPTIFQRKYFSNTNSWNLKNIETQQSISYGAFSEFELNKNNILKASVNHSIFQNHYFFIDSIWRNDTLSNLSLISFDFKAELKYKSLIFQPKIIFNEFSKTLNFIPKIDFRARLGFNKKLFKAQKLDFIVAADFVYQGSRKLMSYATNLDLFVLSNSSKFSNSNLYKIDFFTGFQIEQFRFYLKAENINYLWDKSDSFVFENVPLTPFLIRMGLTWDFFN